MKNHCINHSGAARRRIAKGGGLPTLGRVAQAALLCLALGLGSAAVPQTLPGAASNVGAQLPNLGDGLDMSLAAERKLGDRIAKELYRDPDYVDDAVIMEYVQGIWQPLLAAARLRGELTPDMDASYAWEVLLGRDRSVNAFALPGAYLGLHLGLVAVVTSDDELASVLAHELSHVTQRHISRMITRQSEQAPWLLGAMILGVLAASKSPDSANAMIVGGQAVSAQSQLNFSRDMEREADRIGFGVSTQAGFEAQGFVSMFEKLQQASRLSDSGNFPYLRSHPLSSECMADMQARIAPAMVQTAPQPGRSTMEHSMVAARARVLSNTTVDALRARLVEAQPQSLARLTGVQQAGVLYAASLAAVKQRDFAQAHTLWAQLRDLVRADGRASRLVRLLGAEIWMAQDDSARALEALGQVTPAERALTPASASRAELFLLAQVRQASSPQRVTPSLQTWVAEHPLDASAWQLLATNLSAQNRVVESIRAQAEVSAAQRDYPAALAQLKAAQDLIRKGAARADHIEASIVDTRTRQIESTVREQALER